MHARNEFLRDHDCAACGVSQQRSRQRGHRVKRGAHWISRTNISWLANVISTWMGMWFAVFRTYETIAAQLLAAILVVGSYYAASHVRRRARAASSDLVNATAASSSLSQAAVR